MEAQRVLEYFRNAYSGAFSGSSDKHARDKKIVKMLPYKVFFTYPDGPLCGRDCSPMPTAQIGLLFEL